MNKALRWWSLLLLPSLFFSVASWAETLEVNINEATMINLSQDAKSIFISNTHIADYQPMTNTKIMVFALLEKIGHLLLKKLYSHLPFESYFSKWFFDACQFENGFLTLVNLKMVF